METRQAKRVQLPWGDDLCTYKAGDKLLLTGTVFTARDKTHERLIEAMESGGPVPVRLNGATIFYAGPTPKPEGRPVGVVGPTTSKRMDVYTRRLLSAGVAAVIGKGSRDAEARQAFVDYRALYLVAVGGTAAHLSTRIASSAVVAYEELGAEALHRLELVDFPVYVAIDCEGNDLHDLGPRQWARR